MLDKQMTAMAVTATKTAVHVPWVDTAFRPIEAPSMPEPAPNVKSARKIPVRLARGRD